MASGSGWSGRNDVVGVGIRFGNSLDVKRDHSSESLQVMLFVKINYRAALTGKKSRVFAIFSFESLSNSSPN